jgi:hypothetical protein
MPDGGSSGAPLPAVDIGSVLGAAEVVVAGTVGPPVAIDVSVSRLHARADARYDEAVGSKLAILRTLKGDARAATIDVATLRGRVPGRPWAPLRDGQCLVLFLHSVAPPLWAPVMPEAPALRTLPRLRAPTAAEPLRALASELEQVVERADTGEQAGILVEAALARAGTGLPVDLAAIERPAFAEHLRRAAWLAIALAAGQTEALAPLIPLFATTNPTIEPVLALLVPAVSELRDPSGFANLLALTTSGCEDMAWAAAYALRHIDHPRAAAELVGLLESPSQRVRYQAVMGLAEREPNLIDGGPAVQRYGEDEARYVGPWREWWHSRCAAASP